MPLQQALLPLRAVALLLFTLCLDLTAGQDAGELLRLGDASFANSEYNAAIRHYSSAIAASSGTALPYTKRAAAYISLRQLSQALRDLNKAIELDSSFVQGYIHRGKLQRQMCNFAAAERDFNKVLELRPGQKTAVQELERTIAVKSKFDATDLALSGDVQHHTVHNSRALLEALYQDVQDCLPAQLLEARLDMKLGEYEQVVAVTGRILKADDRQLDALVLRGRAYFYLNDNDMAKRHFGEALKFDPDYEPAKKEFQKVKEYDRQRARADRAAEANEWLEAEGLYIAGLHLDPDHRRGNLALWWGLCRARRALGRLELALEACNAVLALEPSHGEAKQTIVQLLIDSERFDEANAKAREFLSQHQNDRNFHNLAREAERRLKMSKRKDYYKILGVEKSAGEREIKRAYRELAKIYHPDKVSGEEEKAAAETQFREVAEAYEVLSDEEKRTRYDTGQDMEEQMGGGHPGFHRGHGGMHFQFQWG